MSQDLLERIKRLAEVDLVRLLDAIEEADDALLELEAGKRQPKSTAAPPPTRRHGTAPPPPPRAARPVSPRRLRADWEAVRGRMVAHIDSELQLVLPTCMHVVSGTESLRGGLKAPLRQMVSEHRDINEGVLAVRIEAARVEPVRREFLTVCRMWDEHVQEEESLIFPEALSELTDEVSIIKGLDLLRGADDIGANLRLAAARNHAVAENAEPEPKGVVSRFFSFLDRKK